MQNNVLFTDTLLALLLFIMIVDFGTTAGLLVPQSDQSIYIWNCLLLLPVCIRRRLPNLAPGLFVLVSAAQLILGPVVTAADIAALIMMYSAVVYAPRSSNRAYIIAGVLMVGAAATAMALQQAFGIFPDNAIAGYDRKPIPAFYAFAKQFAISFVSYGLLLALSVLLAYWTRARERSISIMRQRNEALSFRAQEQGKLAASAERARIARDMHDVVAHTLSIVIIQSDAGRYAAANNPDMAMQTMITIRDEGTRALNELSSLFGTIGREGEAEGPSPPLPGHSSGDLPQCRPDHSPRPASCRSEETRNSMVCCNGPEAPVTKPVDDYRMMESMIAQAGRLSEGAVFDHRVLGEPRPDLLDPRRTMVSYRVMQEALSNVRKHAGPGAQVRIREEWNGEGLVLIIEDQANRDTRPKTMMESVHIGYGLRGMRERLVAIGGELEARPLPPAGFRVRATIPFRSGSTYPARLTTASTTGAEPVRPDAGIHTGSGKGHRKSFRAAVAQTEIPKNRSHDEKERPGGRIRYQPNKVERISAWIQGHYLLADTFLMLLLLANFGAGALEIPGFEPITGTTPSNSVIVLLNLSVLAPLIVRRRFPELSAVLVALNCAIQVFLSPVLPAADVCVIISIYSAMTYGGSRTRRWIPVAVLFEFLLLGLRIVSISWGASSILDFLLGGIQGSSPPKTNPMLRDAISTMIVAAALCLIAMLTALWRRYKGSSLLLLEEREKALNQGLEESRMLAANKERERIGTSMQTEVASTLNTVIDRANSAIDLLEEAKRQGVTPAPDSVIEAFAGIGRQGRLALARMRELLAVLHQSSTTDAGAAGRAEGPSLKPASPLPSGMISGNRAYTRSDTRNLT